MKSKYGHYLISGISIVLIGVFCTMIRCKESTPISPVSKPILYEPCEKDGVVHIIVNEQVNDSTSCVIDSLAISETLNAVDMTNAVKMTFPQTEAVSFSFFGNFTGMENKVGIWQNDYVEKPTYIKYCTNFDMVRNNGGVSYFTSLVDIVDSTRTLDAYAVAFDDDDDHAGEGRIIVTTAIGSDTFQIDASRNTVNYMESASRLDFHLSETTIYYGLHCYDIESFVELKHDAIWVLKRRGDSAIMTTSTSRSGLGLVNEVPEREFTLYGFVPVFERREK